MKRILLAAALAAFAFAAAPDMRADEIDDAIDLFAAEEGLTAEEKIPALKAMVEANLGNPRVSELYALLLALADEAGDEETKQWIGELAADSGGGVLDALGYDADVEEQPTQDMRTADERLLLYTSGDAEAAADAAATEALKTGVPPWMPSDEELRKADEAFRLLGPIPPVPRSTSARVELPEECVADDFLNKGAVVGAIINLRERMRFALGSMSEEAEKEFDRHFDKALEFPSDNIVAWCTNALPIVSALTRLRVALVNEAISFDETLDEMNLARRAGNYEAAHEMMCSLSRTVASMKAIEARMKELMPQFDALGEMPDPAEERKKAAKDYEEALETIREYFTFGSEVEDKSIEGEWVRDGRHVEYRWGEPSDGEEAETGLWDLPVKEFGSSIYGADIFEHPTIYIVPIAEFGEQGIANFYVYGEGLTGYMRTWGDPPRNKALDETDCVDVWMEPCRDGGWVTYFLETNKSGHVTGGERWHLKACKDDDGKDALLVMKHHMSFRVDEQGKKEAPTYHKFETAVYRPTDKVPEAGAASLPLPLSDASARGMATGTTVEEKKRAAEKTVRECAEQYAETARKVGEMAKAAPFEEAPPPYHLYYVLVGTEQKQVERHADLSHDPGKAELSPYHPDAKRRIMNLGAKEPNPHAGQSYTVLNNATSDDEGMDDDYIRISDSLSVTDHSNTNCFDQMMNYEVSFPHNGKEVSLDSAYASFLLEWTHPTTVLKAWDNEACKMTLWPKIKYEPCRKQDRFNDDTVKLDVSFGRWWLASAFDHIGSTTRDEGRVPMGRTEIACTVKTPHRVELAFNMGNVLKNKQSVDFDIHPKMGDLDGDTLGFTYTYLLVPMTAEEARELANNLDAQLLDEAREAWKEVPEEGLAQAKAEKKSEEEQALDETKEFHRNNIKWLDETISRLQKQLGEAKTQGERDSLRVALAGAQADRMHEEDMIRAAETGEFHASRTPWDDLSAAKFREDIAREVKEISEAEHARKFVENMAPKLQAGHEADVCKQLEALMEEDPLNAGKMMALSDQVKAIRVEELENDPSRIAAFERAARLDKIVTGLEYTKAGCEVAISIGCGGGGWSSLKVLGCVYMATTGYMEGGPEQAFKKTVTFAYDAVDVASSFIDGCVEGGWKEGLKRGEVSFALNYGIPFLVDKMKGPPDMTGCHNSFDVEKLSKWNPKAATRKPPVSAVNAAHFEEGLAKFQIEDFKAKKDAYMALRNSPNPDPEQFYKAKSEFYNAVGKVDQNIMAKAQLKYNKTYLNDGTAQSFAESCGKIQDMCARKTLVDMRYKKGCSKVDFLDFRNEGSRGSIGMDRDLGLAERRGMEITCNGRKITTTQYAEMTQQQMNVNWKEYTGCDAQQSFINITYSKHPEAYKRLELLKNSGNAQYMSEIFRSSRPDEVVQAFDVSRFKAEEMAQIKGHPEIAKRYEQLRAWDKDYSNIYRPAIEGELAPLQAERVRLAKFGRDLPTPERIKCEKLEATLRKFDEYDAICKQAGHLEIPVYEANERLRAKTDKDIPELIEDLKTTFQALNMRESKNVRGLAVVGGGGIDNKKTIGLKEILKRVRPGGNK